MGANHTLPAEAAAISSSKNLCAGSWFGCDWAWPLEPAIKADHTRALYIRTSSHSLQCPFRAWKPEDEVPEDGRRRTSRADLHIWSAASYSGQWKRADAAQ